MGMAQLLRCGVSLWSAVALATIVPAGSAMAQKQERAQVQPTAIRVEGPPTIPLGNYDLGKLGYTVEEFFVSGSAQSYRFAATPGADGPWTTVPDATASYVTRVVVVRPINPAKFSGTVITEWMNVSGGADLAAEWNMAHREMIRNGDAYVAVSAQKVGVEGGGGALGASLPALKQANAQRYARLSHPGDAFAYDIFSQVGRLLKDSNTALLGPLHAKRLLATGESQSAVFLVTYVNAVDPLARVYDGFLIHSRFGSTASITGADILKAAGAPDVKIRADVRVPVMTIISETDLIDGPLPGFAHARQADTQRLRTWEMAGTAHADRYAIMVTSADSGSLPIGQLAAAYDATDLMGMKLPMRINDGPQQHYVVQSAFRQLDRWIATGKEPPASPRLDLAGGKLQLDANGIATGGIRTPWVDVPVSRLSGTNASRSGFLALFGSSEHFDRQKLEQLYPGGEPEYLSKFKASLDAAIAKGFLQKADRQEILDLASASYARRIAP